MELQMKAICEGRSTKADVVHQSLEQYREVFIRTNQQIGVLKDFASIMLQLFTFVSQRKARPSVRKYILGQNVGHAAQQQTAR
ncbi:hypothetical protein LTS18_005839 [Coniosporium uncinatum]|uniref:Uncharacterized protein n=1 Tax=Coniosporium uncinatum TaxID=93489 RepID=A0ACC3DR97_9PEZI|nr:hypothetical protein LTS18_005839 [Coniosporium uncinatum]